MKGQAGAWCGPRSGAHRRKVWSPAALSAFPIPVAAWRWIASSLQEKVGNSLTGVFGLFWISPFVSCKLLGLLWQSMWAKDCVVISEFCYWVSVSQHSTSPAPSHESMFVCLYPLLCGSCYCVELQDKSKTQGLLSVPKS